jgi:hypothetical protein
MYLKIAKVKIMMHPIPFTRHFNTRSVFHYFETGLKMGIGRNNRHLDKCVGFHFIKVAKKSDNSREVIHMAINT